MQGGDMTSAGKASDSGSGRPRDQLPQTVGELRASGYADRTVKQEVAANAARRLAEGRPVVDGLVGFDDSVLPALETALLCGHDIILLGERGQAKSRILRSLVDLLDERMPVVAGSEVNDHPYRPFSPAMRATPRSWRRPTSRSPTSSVTSIRSRWPRAATWPTS
jgi:Mg-chelatase subunit ChlI